MTGKLETASLGAENPAFPKRWGAGPGARPRNKWWRRPVQERGWREPQGGGFLLLFAGDVW